MSKIKRPTKVQEGSNVLITSIPKTICEVLDLKKGDELTWEIEKNEAKFKKME